MTRSHVDTAGTAIAIEQSSPVHPASRAQTPGLQAPWLQQPYGATEVDGSGDSPGDVGVAMHGHPMLHFDREVGNPLFDRVGQGRFQNRVAAGEVVG